MSLIRKHARALIVAVVAAGTTAAVLGAGPAGAHLGSFGHLKSHFITKKVAYVASAPVTVPTTGFNSATALCPANFVAVGGGASTDYSGDNAELEASYPSSATATSPAEPPGTTVQQLGTNAWTVSVENFGGDDLNFRAVAVCVKGTAQPAISGTPYRLIGTGGGSSER